MDDFDDDSIHSSDGAASDDSEEACRILSSSKEKRNRNRKWEDATSVSSDGEEDASDENPQSHPKAVSSTSSVLKQEPSQASRNTSMMPPPFPPSARPAKSRRTEKTPTSTSPSPTVSPSQSGPPGQPTDGELLSALLAGGDASVDTFLDGIMKVPAKEQNPGIDEAKTSDNPQEYSSDDILADLMDGDEVANTTNALPEPQVDQDQGGSNKTTTASAVDDDFSNFFDDIGDASTAPSALDQLLAGQPKDAEGNNDCNPQSGEGTGSFDFLAKISSATASGGAAAKRKREPEAAVPPGTASGKDVLFSGMWAAVDDAKPSNPAADNAQDDDLAALYRKCSEQQSSEWTLASPGGAAAPGFWASSSSASTPPGKSGFGSGSSLWSALDKAAVKQLPGTGTGHMAFGTDRWGAPAGGSVPKRSF